MTLQRGYISLKKTDNISKYNKISKFDVVWNFCHFKEWNLVLKLVHRGIFRTQYNIYDDAFSR